MSRTGLRRWFAASVAGCLLTAAYPASLAVPSTEAVRLRNAFLIERGTPADFAWTPATRPADFRWERNAPSPRLAGVARSALGAERRSFEGGLLIAAHLLANAKDLGPIQASLDETYDRITRDGYGYCADFTDVYLALAHAAGIPARQWAFSFDGFGGHGHAFIEVFDASRDKWLMIDVYNNFHPLDRPGGEPMSALEFRRRLLDGASLHLQPISGARLGYPIADKAIDYYRRGASEWYLWWGNDVYTYDRDPAVRVAAKLGRPVEQLVAVAADRYPHFRVLEVEPNARKIERMATIRRNLLVAALAGIVFLVSAIAAGALWWRAARRDSR
jgi:hypothetical protein